MQLLDRPLAVFYEPRRVRVLDVLLVAAEELSGRAIAALAGISPTTANLALEELADAGLVTSRPVGRATLWRTAEGAPVLEQLRSVARAGQDEVCDILVDALGSEPVSITLYGSTARGTAGASSDVDILVVAPDEETESLFRRRSYVASRRLRALLGRPVQITLMDQARLKRTFDSSFVTNVITDGRTLRGVPLALIAP